MEFDCGITRLIWDSIAYIKGDALNSLNDFWGISSDCNNTFIWANQSATPKQLEYLEYLALQNPDVFAELFAMIVNSNDAESRSEMYVYSDGTSSIHGITKGEAGMLISRLKYTLQGVLSCRICHRDFKDQFDWSYKYNDICLECSANIKNEGDIKDAEKKTFARCIVSHPINYVYFLLVENGLIKIGKSYEPEKRAQNQIASLPIKGEYLFSIPYNDPFDLEKYLHEKYSPERVKSEYFNIGLRGILEVSDLFTPKISISIEMQERIYNTCGK